VNVSTVCYARIHRTGEALALLNDVPAPVGRTGEQDETRRDYSPEGRSASYARAPTVAMRRARCSRKSIYNWFTEGFDTADLQDARALLEQLST